MVHARPAFRFRARRASKREGIAQDEQDHVDFDPHRLPTQKTQDVGMDGTGLPLQSRETAGKKGK